MKHTKIMGRIVLFSLLISMMGCEQQNVEIEVSDYVISGHSPLRVVEIEGCQYLYGDWANATVLTHKGNCNNPIHIHNGGSHE